MHGLSDLSVTDRYLVVADNFGRLVAGVNDWNAPTPVAEWTARDVVGHFTSWVPEMVGGGSGLTFPSGPSETEDPVAAWALLDGRLREILADPTEAATAHRNPHTGEAPVAQVIDRYITPDLVFHAWDLARASGQDPELDEAYLADAHAGMSQMGDVIRGSGQFGEQQPVATDASATERFFAFIGRDPHWTP